jgi:hypothetical protein
MKTNPPAPRVPGLALSAAVAAQISASAAPIFLGVSPVKPTSSVQVDQQQLQAQKALFQAQTAAGIKPVTAIFHTAGVTRKVGVLRPEVGLFQPGGAAMGKTWSHSFESRDTLGASFSGEINVNGSDNGLSANGGARASGAILGNEWDLIRVTGSLSARLGIRGQAGVQYGMGVNATGINVSLKPKVVAVGYLELRWDQGELHPVRRSEDDALYEKASLPGRQESPSL